MTALNLTWYQEPEPTQGVDQADPEHVEREQGVVDVLPSHVVHEDVVEDGAHGRREAGQVVGNADPAALHLRPGNAERQQHQEKEERDAWRVEERRTGGGRGKESIGGEVEG